MIYNNLNLPATLVHSVNGKKYTLNGKLLSINESTKTATMQFGDKTNSNIPLKEVYLNEGALKDIIKKAGKKLKDFAIATWNKIVDIVKVTGGLLVPVDESGEEISDFINAPINLPLMPLPEAIKVIPAQSALNLYDEYGARVRNNSNIDEAFAQSLKDDKDEIETYWTRVMKEYANPENESLTLSDTVKMVNEKYYHRVLNDNVLNESAIPSLNSPSGLYGEQIGTNDLVGMIVSNIKHQLNPVINHKRTDEDIIAQLRGGKNYVKPLIIWGAPGIGKTAILKQAARLLKDDGENSLNLDMVTVCCGGIKVDDFELPDTAKNVIGHKVAISTPKTWLPVFSIASLTDEQLLEANEFYNSGRFRILASSEDERAMSDEARADLNMKIKNDVVDWQSLGTGKTYDGGIIFFDEFARLRNLKIMDTMMTLCGDRTYVEMPLATNWVTIAAANRLSDDFKSEADKDFHDLWDAAKQSRFTPYTYAPTKAEWLKWARDIDDDGFQNVDEIICKFIEKSPEYVWYDALDFKSREIEGHNKAAIESILDKWYNKENITAKELKVFGSYISNPGNSLANMSNYTWNPRTWHQKINKAIMSLLLNDIFAGDFDKYEACFSETTRVKTDYKGQAKEYQAKNLDPYKLKKELNSIPENVWLKNTAGKIKQELDPNDNLRYNDRVAWFWAAIAWYIMAETGGENSKPSQEWKKYNSIDSVIEPGDIQFIYEKGGLKGKAAQREDNIYFGSRVDQFTSHKNISWKSNMDDVNQVASMVLDAYNEYITPKQILDDYEAMKKRINNPKYETTPADIKDYIDKYTIHLTDETGKEVKTIQTFLSNAVPHEAGIDKLYVFILKNSEVARRLANMATWLAKISWQCGNFTPAWAAYGIDNKITADGTIYKRYTNIILNDPTISAMFKDPANSEIVDTYDLTKPALDILKASIISKNKKD